MGFIDRYAQARKFRWELLASVAALCWALYAFRHYLPELDQSALTETYRYLRELARALGLVDILLVLWLWMLAYWLGRKLLDRFEILFDSTAERLSFASAAGLAAISFTVFLLAATRILHSAVAYALLAVATALCWRRLAGLARKACDFVAWGAPRRISGRSVSRAFWLLYMTVVLGVVLISALGPEIEFDPLFNHLQVAKVIAETHRLRPLRDIPQTFFPKHTTILFSLGMLLHNEITAKLIHYLFGLLTIIAAYALARRLLSRNAGLIAAAIVVSSPIFIWEMRTAHVDCGFAFYCFLSLYATILWLRSGAKTWSWLAVSLTAWSLGTKYQALFSLGSLAFLIFAETLLERKNLRMAGASALKFCAIASLGTIPWGIVNLAETRNPVFPFLNGIFNSPYWNPAQTATALLQMKDSGVSITLSTWWNLFLFPWRMAVDQTDRFHGNIGPFYLILIPLLLLIPQVRREIKLILIFSALYTLFWLYTGQHSRYYLPVLPALAVVAAYALVRGLILLRDRGYKILAAGAPVVLGLMFVFNTPFFESYGASARYGNSILDTLPWKVLLGQESSDHYLSEILMDYPLVQYLNALPGRRKVLFWWNSGPIAFYVKGETSLVFSYFFDRLGGDDVPRMHRTLLENHITHVIINQLSANTDFFSDPEKEFIRRYLKPIYKKNANILYEVSPQPLTQETVSYAFLNHIEEAAIRLPAAGTEKPNTDYRIITDIGEDRRYALLTRSPGEAEFPVILGERPVMRFAIGRKWPPCLARASFQLWIRKAGQDREILFSREINAQNASYEVGWHENELDLSSYAGQNVTITFKTASFGNEECNWFLWADPEIVSRPPLPTGRFD